MNFVQNSDYVTGATFKKLNDGINKKIVEWSQKGYALSQINTPSEVTTDGLPYWVIFLIFEKKFT